MYPDSDSDSSSSCSTAASPGGDTPGCSQHPPDSLSSSVDSTKDSESSTSDSFVPTVTAVSTSRDLRWMVQPTVLTSVSASSGRARSKPSHRQPSAGATKAKSSSRKGPREQPSREEEERRRIRRERNKIAAAKCRNRRRELIDTLQAETDELEEERSALQTEINDLLKEKERLEQVLASHRSSCKLPAGDDDDDGGGEEEDEEVLEEEEEEEDSDDEEMMQDPPTSPQQLLSIIENGKPPESATSNAAAPLIGQDMDDVPCIPPAAAAEAAILGNSDILLCASSAEDEALQDLRGDDLDDLVPSLEAALSSDAAAAASVPDIDLSSPFCLSDWETLYKSVASDLECLNTPVMSSSPTCSSFRTMFSFSYPEIESLAEGGEGLRGGGGGGGGGGGLGDSLNSPTLLAL